MHQQTAVPQQQDFSFVPVLKIYLDSMESWKENCEKIVQQTREITNSQSAALPACANEQTVEGWQKMSEAMFRGFVERQIELCHFYGRRWERYLELPERMARCKTPGDLVQLEREFVTRMTQDYADEGAKLARPLAELADSWPMGRMAYPSRTE